MNQKTETAEQKEIRELRRENRMLRSLLCYASRTLQDTIGVCESRISYCKRQMDKIDDILTKDDWENANNDIEVILK